MKKIPKLLFRKLSILKLSSYSGSNFQNKIYVVNFVLEPPELFIFQQLSLKKWIPWPKIWTK